MTQSDIAHAVDVNPDPEVSECPATGLIEPGVVFPHAPNPLMLSTLFLSKTAINEAFAVLYDVPVKNLPKLLKANDGLKEAQVRIKELEAELAKWATWRDKAEDIGLVVTPI